MPYRLTLLLLLVFTLLPSGARALDWSTSLVPPQGPLPVFLGQAQELSDGSVLLAGQGQAALLSDEDARVRVIARVGVDGSIVWTTQLGIAAVAESSEATAVLELEGGKLIVAFNRRVYAIDGSTGTVLWEQQLQARIFSLEAGPSTNFYAVGDVVLVPFLQEPYAALLSSDDGSVVWTRPPSSPSPVLTYFKAAKFSNGDLLAAGSGGILVRLSSADGSLIWQTEGPSAPPILSASRIAVDPLDRVAVLHGGSGGWLELRAGDDGALIWSVDEAPTPTTHYPFAVTISEGSVFTASYLEGQSTQVHLRSFSLDSGSEVWRTSTADAAEGPRYLRGVRVSAAAQRVALLLSSSSSRYTQFFGTAGRRLSLFNAGTGNLVSSTELPAGSEAQFADDLTWTAAQGLSLAGVREAASGQPALMLTPFDTAAAVVGASAVVQVSGYAEFASRGLTLTDGSSVVLSRRGGLAQSVFGLTRLDAQGNHLWRTEHLPQTGIDWYFVNAKQADETSLIVVLARSQTQAGQILRIDIETGEILYLRPVISETGSSFRPAVLEVDVSRSMFLIGGTIPGGGEVSWHLTHTGGQLWYGAIASNEFSTSWATIKRMQVMSDGGVLVLSRVFRSEAQFADMLHRFESNGFNRWTRSLGTGMAELDLLQIDESAMEARVWGRSGPPPFFVRELTVSLTDGATLATNSLECSGSGSTSSGWVVRLGAQLVNLLECPVAGTPGYRLWKRATWSAVPSSIEVSGLPFATTILQAAAGSEGRLNVTLGTAVAGASPSIARLNIADARVVGITPLQTSAGQPFSNPMLIGTGSTAIVVGGHEEFERPRIVVGASRDVALFGDGFEN